MKYLLPLCAALAFASPAAAQSRNCGERERVIEMLASTYGEVRQIIGLAANDQMMEVFANPESGSWTITVTLPSGIICLLASGMAFEHTPVGDPA
jgi:hypothetical protein